MEDKTFELLTKMYSEITNRLDSVDKRFDSMDERFDSMDKRFERLENHIIRLENKQDSDSKALFDGYKQIYEKLREHDRRFDVIESRLDSHDTALRLVREDE